jgi:AcrR family transcriptional regulator
MNDQLCRKEREYLQHRDEILQAAEKLFAEIGYHNTSMDMIAEKAEFSKGSLYNYFKNKEYLFFCMLDEKLELFSKGLNDRIRKLSDIEDKICALIDFYFDFFNRNAGFFKIAQSERYHLDRFSRENLIKRLKGRYLDHISGLSKIVRESVPSQEEAELLAVSINGVLNSLLTRKLLTGSKIKITILKQTAVNYALKLIK